MLRLYSYFTRFRFLYFHYGDQGIFVKRTVFNQLGGFLEVPIMEDIDFLRRMRKVGRMELIDLPVTTSARRFLQCGIVRQESLNVMLVTLYLLGFTPQTLSRWYKENSVSGSNDARSKQAATEEAAASREELLQRNAKRPEYIRIAGQ